MHTESKTNCGLVHFTPHVRRQRFWAEWLQAFPRFNPFLIKTQTSNTPYTNVTSLFHTGDLTLNTQTYYNIYSAPLPVCIVVTAIVQVAANPESSFPMSVHLLTPVHSFFQVLSASAINCDAGEELQNARKGWCCCCFCSFGTSPKWILSLPYPLNTTTSSQINNLLCVSSSCLLVTPVTSWLLICLRTM